MIDLYPPAAVQPPPSVKPHSSGEPLCASDWWDETCQAVQWETVRYSLLAEAARAVGLKVKKRRDGRVEVWTSAADILLLVAYVQRRNERATNGFVTLAPETAQRAQTPRPQYTFNAPVPDWDDEYIPPSEGVG